MAKAERDGTYELEQNGEVLHFFIAKGDELPEGAKFSAAEAAAEEAEADTPTTRNKGAAPENRAK